MPFRVQRLRAVEGGVWSYTVVDADDVPVPPIERFLAHLAAGGSSPNTVAAYAHDLRDFFGWLDQRDDDFRTVSLEQLAEFFDWLRRPRPARAPGVFVLPGVTPAVGQNTLLRKRAALASFYRFHARRDARVPALLGELAGSRPTGSYTPMLIHTRRGRAEADAYSPIRLHPHRKRPATLTDAQVTALAAACTHLRDRFLVCLLNESGLRLGEALGLRHADLHLRAAEIDVVPRQGNVNDARVKGLKPRVVPIRGQVFDLYADYMETEYGALDCDYVFVNLFREPRAASMTAENVRGLVKRLRARTGLDFFTPHVLRHTYATRLLRAGVRAEVVAELLGHASSQTTEATYSHLKVEDHRASLVAAGVLDQGVRR